MTDIAKRSKTFAFLRRVDDANDVNLLSRAIPTNPSFRAVEAVSRRSFAFFNLKKRFLEYHMNAPICGRGYVGNTERNKDTFYSVHL